ncbi:hypothetical protein A3D05_02410 [Candidatus Gottesmanbacteria bacterium RIFCSPHIGHO2_02_FULL_40_24]|uniref:Uncharacterized protein n=1 Tax=Candidatus Gottesmanbacteria bacterium RIFCSPHIGHO2_01_FULL_40_15 TaxID=1798376 RepID=A0A1F5Z3H8_9BACT|nr:MAG: hypothetical protein A2777_03845 [Candidatus Gottesmanbacteria bacterium RIFCSPHIGHO2_01_FULL_40_15]OGG18703.1 MAG: hypothetical protein A3D05_02410 [Candidatus Gottesmanbacteria bacterium RIFCSPHIGHO2_02_FULL_40_24]OGG22995.1 MAG: hypothetical protein A3E42_06620 [Candidatus Gottesmanbacteria bacterium RIFCSPHIGHO2_12_FULL_40_13]OGG23306.1 MAG: hypothetical protein A3B48_06555 [Candidatus Gottesmanbacteria bacterium RIFCSPLOWO2_01_FULL_40_10]OGG31913.1 MAG: hypothetical protein A3I80_0
MAGFFHLIRPVFAQGLGCGGGLGPIAAALCNINPGDTSKVGTRLNIAISGIIGFLTIIAALWFVIQFIIAGFNWINAGGDKSAAQAAQQKITNAIVGLLIVVLAWVIAGLLGVLLGIDILNPGAMLQKLII